jgi:two-component system phosphate regulon response regulator PhoB
MRSIVFRFDDFTALVLALGDSPRPIPLPEGNTASDGEWVLAIFEVGARRRSTATASRTTLIEGAAHVTFENRDWERLTSFATARSEQFRVAKPISAAPGTGGSGAPAATSASGDPSEAPISDPMASTGRFLAAMRARVLVVEDDPATRQMVVEVMASVGLEAKECGTAEEAEGLLSQGPYDMVVLDVHLPGMSGLELVRRIRARGGNAQLPILLISGQSSSKDIVDAFASGADDFVVKPFRNPELAARIFGLLRRARASQPPP